MNENGNKYALAALRERRAVIGGEITETERKLRYLRDALTYIDGALRQFDPDSDPTTIAGKRPYRRTKLFKKGKLNTLILNALRERGRPMGLAEIVSAIVSILGHGEVITKEITPRVRAGLLYLTTIRRLTVKTGDRATARWAIKP
jgi:hypothetical protein